MKVVDLTRVIRPGMPVYPGDPQVQICAVAAPPDADYRVSKLTMGSHTGTHIDAPAHVLQDGKTLDQIPPGDLMGYGRVFPADTDFDQVDLSDLDFVILDFRWAPHWGRQDFHRDYPAMSSRTAERLAAHKLRGVGMDTPSADNPESGLENHHKLLSNGMVLIENLINLDALEDSRFRLIALPLQWEHADGAPCRVVAIPEENL